MSDVKLSIVVCTYNRCDILKYCLDSLADQSVSKSDYEVVIVDNNSTDDTKKVAKEYCEKNANFVYVFEKINSSSISRNTGSEKTSGAWLGFVDDDAKCYSDYIEKAVEIIDQNKFDCFGGRYIAWYLKSPPKWIKKMDIGTAPVMMEKAGILQTQHLSGTSFFVRKNVFEMSGGFDPGLGIKGDKRGYGEETELVNRMRNSGWIIGYDPDLVVEHLVNPEKFSLIWHFKDIVAHSKTEYLVWIQRKKRIEKIRMLKNGILSFFISSFNATIILIKNDCYWQNYIIDVLRPFMKLLGYFQATIKSKNK